MEIQDLKPRKGDDTYRIGDSDDLVLMENIGAVPSGGVCLQNHGIIFFIAELIETFAYIYTLFDYLCISEYLFPPCLVVARAGQYRAEAPPAQAAGRDHARAAGTAASPVFSPDG